MHDNFADWYRDAGLTPDRAVHDARWRGVEAYCAAATRTEVLGLLKAVCLSEPLDSTLPERFRAAFKTEDTTFSSRGNDLEMRVLSGACLRVLMESGAPHIRPVAALGLMCGGFGRPAPSWVGEHVSAAEARALTLATERRKRDAAPDVQRPTFDKKKFLEVNQPHFTGNSLPNLSAPLSDALSELAATSTTNAAVLQWLLDTVNKQEEELDIFWWMQAAFSSELKKGYELLEAGAALLVAPAELSQHVTIAPPPPTAGAVLVRTLSTSVGDLRQPFAIGSAVNATPRPWREAQRDSHPTTEVGALCPLSLAIVTSLATLQPEDWYPVFEAQCAVSVRSAEREGLQIALQLFNERMFMKSLAQWKV